MGKSKENKKWNNQKKQEKTDFTKRMSTAKYGDTTWKSEWKRFGEQLAPFGLFIKDVAGDGNCMFRAVADQLIGDPTQYMTIRQKCVDFIEKNREDFEPFMAYDFRKYCEIMRKNATWGGNLELQAITQAFQVNITVHQADQPRWELHHFPENSAPTLHLSYHNGEHYASVRKIGNYSGLPLPIVIKLKEKKNKHPDWETEGNPDEQVMMGSTGYDLKTVRETLKEFGGMRDSAIEYLLILRQADENELRYREEQSSMQQSPNLDFTEPYNPDAKTKLVSTINDVNSNKNNNSNTDSNSNNKSNNNSNNNNNSANHSNNSNKVQLATTESINSAEIKKNTTTDSKQSSTPPADLPTEPLEKLLEDLEMLETQQELLGEEIKQQPDDQDLQVTMKEIMRDMQTTQEKIMKWQLAKIGPSQATTSTSNASASSSSTQTLDKLDKSTDNDSNSANKPPQQNELDPDFLFALKLQEQENSRDHFRDERGPSTNANLHNSSKPQKGKTEKDSKSNKHNNNNNNSSKGYVPQKENNNELTIVNSKHRGTRESKTKSNNKNPREPHLKHDPYKEQPTFINESSHDNNERGPTKQDLLLNEALEKEKKGQKLSNKERKLLNLYQRKEQKEKKKQAPASNNTNPSDSDTDEDIDLGSIKI